VTGLAPPGARRVGWLDLSCGASGDMLLGALVDAGVPADVLTTAIDTLGLPIRLEVRQVRRAGLAATKVDVVAPETDHARTWTDIRALLAGAPLDPATRDLATATFAALAAAEARVHGIDAAEVHFHEVGALDSIADVVGVSAGLVHLGLRELVATPIALGGGRARMAHGVLPIPGPAVLELLRAAGAPAVGGPVPVELCTPTGAALVTTAVTGYGDLPPLRVTAVGSGAGTRDLPGRPNLVRLVIGESLGAAPAPPSTPPALARDEHPGHAHSGHASSGHTHSASGGASSDEHSHSDHSRGPHRPGGDPHGAPGEQPTPQARRGATVPDDRSGEPASGDGSVAGSDGVAVTAELVLEANVDDLDPRVWPSVLAALLAAGAADAWLTPILMKKGRPAHTLRALVAPRQLPAVRATLFQHTSTLGLREIPVRKHALPRAVRAVEVAGHPIRVKISPGPVAAAEPTPGREYRVDPPYLAQPEWDDVALVAAKLGWPARQVLAAASARAHAGEWSDPPVAAGDAPPTNPGPDSAPDPEPKPPGSRRGDDSDESPVRSR